jgi:hypothetical protein
MASRKCCVDVSCKYEMQDMIRMRISSSYHDIEMFFNVVETMSLTLSTTPVPSKRSPFIQ